MSINDKLVSLETDRTNIRTALVNKGITEASSHGFSRFATDINSIVTGGGTPTIQPLTVSVSRTEQNVKAEDLDVDGFSPVTVPAAPLQDKAVTPNFKPSDTILNSVQVSKDGSNYGLGIVTINKDSYLVPENIKSGVTIFGIPGNYEGKGGVPASETIFDPATITTNDGWYGPEHVVFTWNPASPSAVVGYSVSYDDETGFLVVDVPGPGSSGNVPLSILLNISKFNKGIFNQVKITFGDVHLSSSTGMVNVWVRAGTKDTEFTTSRVTTGTVLYVPIIADPFILGFKSVSEYSDSYYEIRKIELVT